uniref:WSN domain-containing protein n=1 Tax=Caenorhabditis japonica TaxID=281687 RepID=A0A8R1EPE7_CAEJA
MKKIDVSNTANYKNVKLVTSSLLVLIVGIVLLQDFTSLTPGISGLKTHDKRDVEFKNYEDAEVIMAVLARVMNAIALQRDLLNGTTTAKELIYETLGVQNSSLLDQINQTKVRNAINDIMLLDSSMSRPMGMINEITELLDDKLWSHSHFNLTEPPIINISTPFDAEGFHVYYHLIDDFNSTFTAIVEESKKQNFNDSKIYENVEELKNILSKINQIEDTKNPNKKIKELVKSLEGVDLLVSKFERYQLLIYRSFLNDLNERVGSLQPPVKIIESWLNSGDHKRIEEQLMIIDALTNTTAKIVDDEALIGFPKGSTDMKTLPKVLKNRWLRHLLNEGKSLKKLEDLLLPIVNFWRDIARAERVLTTTSSRGCSNVIRQSLKNLEKIDAFNSTSISSALANVTAVSKQLIADFKIPFFDEFKQLLNFSQSLKRLSFKLEAVANWKKYDIYIQLHRFKTKYEKSTTEDEKRNKLRNEFLTNRYKDLEVLQDIGEEDKLLIESFVSKPKEFNRTMTDALLGNIQDKMKLPQQIESDIKVVRNYVEFIKSLYMLTRKEQDAIKRLPDFLFVVKNIMDDGEMMSKSLKSQIEGTKGFQRLAKLSSARDTTLQLLFIHQSLILYQRPDLHQIVQNFLRNFMALSEKIASLPHLERKFIGSQLPDFSSINITMSIFLSKVKSLPHILTVKEKSLELFAQRLSVLDKVEIPFQEIDSIITVLDRVKLTSIGKSQEVLEAEKSIEVLRRVQCSLLRQSSLSELLGQADTFFKSLFPEPRKLRTKWTTISLAFISLATIILVLLLCSFLRTKNMEDKRVTAGKSVVKGKGK